MSWERSRGFLARRLSAEEALGLHLTVGLLVSLLLVGVFAFIAHGVGAYPPLLEFDTRLGERLRDYRESAPMMRRLFLAITFIGSVSAISALTIAATILLILRRRYVLPLLWLVTVAGGGLIDANLKLLYERERPPFRDPAILESTKSFPSGHSMGSVVGYGFLAYLLWRLLPRKRYRVALVAAVIVLILAIGFSRIFLGAHYFSDVIGGYTVGAAWLAFCISGAETVRRRRLARAAPGAL